MRQDAANTKMRVVEGSRADGQSTDTTTQFAYAMRAKIRRHQELHILLVEDDDSDVMLTECALGQTYIPHRLYTLKNGSEVLRYLRREAPFAAEPLPDLILLDLSLPQKDGFEVLAELTQEAAFASIPIIILSGAQDYRHILTSDHLWLSDYLPKPCNADQLLTAFGKLHSPKKLSDARRCAHDVGEGFFHCGAL